jgi:hypothetical protein
MLQVYEVEQGDTSSTHGRKLKFFWLVVFAVVGSGAIIGAEAGGAIGGK